MTKSVTCLAVAAAVATLAATAATAAPWQNVNARQARIEARIEQGIRSGALNRKEARRLRKEARDIVYLEDQYRRGGLSMRERVDLDRRLNALSVRVRAEKTDRQTR